MDVRQLRTKRAARELSWTFARGLSVRAYLHGKDSEECPCVSTRSAEIVVVMDGEVELEAGPERRHLRVREGEAAWIPRGLPHAIRAARDARALVVDHTMRGPDTLRHAPAASLARQLSRAWERRAPDALSAVTKAGVELASTLAGRPPIVLESLPSTRRMTAVKRILEDRFADPPSLAELARATKTSEFYLLRNFKRHFVFTPFAYAQFLRTEHFFWELLGARDDRTLLSLAADAGFDDYSTFQRRIRSLYGIAPSELVDAAAAHTLGPL